MVYYTIRQNEKHLFKLWQNQTSIVESEYNLLKRTEDLMTKQHKIINQQLIKLEQNSNTIQREIDNLTLVQHFTLMSLAANNLFLNLKRSQDLLLEILTDIHHGEFNLHLLTPKQLQQEIRLISSQLSADVTLPIKSDNIQKIYQLLKIKARVTKDYFLFEITFPLINRARYKLYKIVPVPHQTGNLMVQYTPTSEYVATDLKKDTYFKLREDDLSTSCFNLEDEYICNLKKPIYHLSSDNNFCEIDFRTEKCMVTQTKCRNEWVPLTNPSLILYHVCGNYTIKIICNTQVSVEWLHRAGILYLGNGCLLKGLDFTLHIPEHKENEVHISASVYTLHPDQLNYLVNTTMVWDDSQNSSETGGIQTDLQNLHNRTDEMKKVQVGIAETFSPHNIHHYVVNYSLVGVVAAATAVLLWRRRQRRCEQGAHISQDIELRPAPVPAPELGLAPALPPRVPEVSASARQNRVHSAVKQPSAEYSAISERVNNSDDKSCSPIPRQHFGTLHM